MNKLPFKGICERPYSQDLLADVNWRQAATLLFPVSTLWCTQKILNIDGLFGLEPYSTDEYPHVVYYNAELYIEDGHHRLVRAALEGKTQAHCAVWAVWAVWEAK